MKKSTIILLSVLGGIIVIAAVITAFLFIPKGITPALLYIQNGTVQVDLGSGYVPAQDGMELSQAAKIRTGNDAKATVVLHESVFVTLEPGTEIAIADLAKQHMLVNQTTGTVWSKVSKLGGVEQYSVRTPSTTATVRGTIFKTEESGAYTLLVAEGTVNADPENVDVQAKQKIIYENGTYHFENLTAEDLQEIRDELQHEITMFTNMRLHEVYKNANAVAFMKKTYGATDDDIANYLTDIDAGRKSEDEIRQKAPMITPEMNRIFAYDAEIHKTMATLQAYS